MIAYHDFEKVYIRVGTIIEVHDFPEAHKPAYKLGIDFGFDLEIKRSSAHITKRYSKEELLGKQILAGINFSEKMGKFFSQVLTRGVPDEQADRVLGEPGFSAPHSVRLF